MTAPNDDDVTHLTEAFTLADAALAAGEVPVGCVLVAQNGSGAVLGRGRNDVNRTNNATRHAELVAVECVPVPEPTRGDLDWTTVCCYVTVEPCVMCAHMLRQLNVGRIVFGCRNERFGGLGSVVDVRTYEPKWNVLVHEGERASDAVRLLRLFYAQENPNAPEPIRKGGRMVKPVVE